jgi:excisionase family DNA binding protein
MEKLLTTKDLAEALGASESSTRRWTDSGAIKTARTVGGHRRIPLSEAIRFVRETRSPVVRPDILGLGTIDARATRGSDQRLFDALHAGDAPGARAITLGLFLAGSTPAELFDGPAAHALHRIGELWQHGPSGILVERRASDICVQIVSELRGLLPAPPTDAPLAVGAAPAGDPYLLPSMMVSAVMADAGYREENFGPHTPVAPLGDAAEARGARVVWLSVSVDFPDDARAALRHEVEALAARLAQRGAHLVLGGRHAAGVAPSAARNAHVLQSLGDLAAFARGLHTPA